MSTRPDAEGGPVRPLVALAFATAAFIALLIFGLGMVSLAIGEAVIEVPGLGQLPGILGTILTTAAFAGTLWAAVRRRSPTYWGAVWTAGACYLAYVVGVWFGAVVTGSDLAAAGSAAGRIATSWFGVVVAAAALVAAWGGIALVRTRSQRPRWPWEDEFDE